MKDYFIDRFKEASTWRGIVIFLTAIGVPIAPALADTIIAAGLGIAGLIGMLIPDRRA